MDWDAIPRSSFLEIRPVSLEIHRRLMSRTA
jgi:hypothetical protein